MEHWNHKSLQQHRFQHRRERQNPSFSSSLLDQIYHSIDQLDHQRQPPALAMKHQQTYSKRRTTTTTTTTTTTSTSSSSTSVFGDKELDLANFQRACLIEKWMDQKKKPANSEKIKYGSAREFTRNSGQNGDAMLLNSSSSSSESSCGGLFSSDTETNVVKSSSSWGSYTDHRPKPIRTTLSSTQPADQKKSKHDINIGGGFVKTKSKALKIYRDLKKAGQPISPGGKLANFLNSIFNSASTSASAKKTKNYEDDDDDDQRKSKSAQASSTCSFSRSCLSKTPTSSSSSSGGKTEKRSVRFSPVSVMIVHQHDKYMSDNIIREKSCINEEIRIQIKEKNRRIEEAARNLLANYQKKVDQCHEIMEEEDDDDDDASCASSDLFELDTLSSIPGIEMYCQELPVYETTYFHTNPPIPTALIM